VGELKFADLWPTCFHKPYLPTRTHGHTGLCPPTQCLVVGPPLQLLDPISSFINPNGFRSFYLIGCQTWPWFITLLSWWVVFSGPPFKFSLKQLGFQHLKVRSKIYCGTHEHNLSIG
jgi:hypothetical protein